MSDRIVLTEMLFLARHGVEEWERVEAQSFEVDIELLVDLAPAGRSDDLSKTVDYSAVYETVRRNVEERQFGLIEALATAIADAVLAEQSLVQRVIVRVRKPEVRLGGPLRSAAVEIERSR